MDTEWIDIKVSKVFYAYLNNKTVGKRINPLLERRLEAFVGKFANALFDYGAVTCLGELRYATYKLKNWDVEFYVGGKKCEMLEGSYNRNRIYNNLPSKLDVREMLKVAIELFCDYEWEDCYGGACWGEIATCVLNYLEGKYNAVGFIDRMVNKVHNGKILFNKEFIFCGDDDEFRGWLYCRQKGDFDEYFTSEFLSIVREYNEEINNVMAYIPIEWGEGKLEFELSDKGESYEMESEDVSDDSNVSDEEKEESYGDESSGLPTNFRKGLSQSQVG